jgi:hypothetical protein
MGKAIVKLYISTYAGEEYVVEVPCKKDDIDELIITRAWKIVKDEEGGSLPYGNRYAEILRRSD